MSVYLNDIADSVRESIVAALPELLPLNGGGGVFELESVEAVSYDDLALTLPYASMRFSTYPGSTNSPTACNYYETDLEVVIVADVNGNNDNLRPLLERLRDYVRTNGFSLAQELPQRTLDISDTIPANRIFISKGDTQRCGKYATRLLFGDGPTL